MQMQMQMQIRDTDAKFCKYAEAVKADEDKQARIRYSSYRYRYTVLRYALIELTANELTH